MSDTDNIRKTLGTEVPLKSGQTVLVVPWGIGEQETAAPMVADLFADFVPGAGASVIDHLRKVAARQVSRVVKLLALSLENGAEDLKKLVGPMDTMRVVNAVLDVNDIVEFAGNLIGMAGLVRELRQSQEPAIPDEAPPLQEPVTPEPTETGSPEGSST